MINIHPILLFDDLKIYHVSSDSSNNTYIVSIDNEEYVFCSCPHFTYRLSKDNLVKIDEKEKHCKHIRRVLNANEIFSSKGSTNECKDHIKG